MDEVDRFYAQLGERIRDLRRKRRLSQDALAKCVKLNRTSVTNIERGRQKVLLHTFVDFARALCVKPGLLIPDAEPESDIPEGLAPPAKEFVERVVHGDRKQR